MIDYSQLKAAAEDAISKEPGSPGQFLALQRMNKLANPAALLALIVVLERQSAQFKEWQASHHANYVCVADERDQLRAEIAGLKTGYAAHEEEAKRLQDENESLKAIIASDERKLDALLNHCDDGECATCAQIICPHGDGMHFHHDGCPTCAQEDGHD